MTRSNHFNHSLSLPSPAKINLFLHINNQRSDGYHELQTIFQFIDLADTLTFTTNTTGQIQLSCNDKSLENDNNLIIKAANLLHQYTDDKSSGIDIKLNKVLPAGGGVGGGSSNAATTLLALNHLWQLNLDSQQLAKIGLTLGADVPVFIHGKAVFDSGVGEIFTPYNPPEQWYLIARPECHISTAEVFTHPQLVRDTAKIQPRDYNFTKTRNDCESLVKKLYPEVANTISRLLEYAPTRLTGTGSCIFSCFEDKQSAEKAMSYLPLGVRGFVAKGQNESMTIAALKETVKFQ